MYSYSNALIKWILTHYCDVLHGKVTPEEMQDFCRSTGRKNPLETVLTWKADIDQAIISLAPRMTGWDPAEITSADCILQLGRSNLVSRMQRDIINDCVLHNCMRDCKDTGAHGSKLCYNEGIISRLRRYLNKEYTNTHIKQRDSSGLFVSTGS